MITPPYLKKDDIIAIVAPAGFLKSEETLQQGIVLAESWGLKVKVYPHVYYKNGHFAGADAERLADLQNALDDTSVKTIWCARGGYGTNRIVDDLDFTSFKKHPKWVIGYSDITVLLNKIDNLGIESLHAMMATSINAFKNVEAVASLKQVLFGQNLSYKIKSNQHNVFGRAEGILVGGNLSLLAACIGTSSEPNFKDSIVFIEDIGEYLYRIDRMLYTLKRHGVFKQCKAVLVGGMTDIPENDPPFGKSIEQLILEVVDNPNIPICFDVPAGHIEANCALILGRTMTLNVDSEMAVIHF